MAQAQQIQQCEEDEMLHAIPRARLDAKTTSPTHVPMFLNEYRVCLK